MKKLNLERLIDAVPDTDPKVRVETYRNFGVYSYIHLDYNTQDVVEALTSLSAADVDSLKDELERRKGIMDTLASETEEIAMKWRVHSKARMLLESAVKIIETEKAEHTGNKWVTSVDENLTKSHISNAVYIMNINICKRERMSSSGSIPIPQWTVTWGVRANKENQWGSVIHGQEKRFSDTEQAEKYVEKIKIQHAGYFTFINPPIPRKYANHFTVFGVLPPGYALEPETPSLREAS